MISLRRSSQERKRVHVPGAPVPQLRSAGGVTPAGARHLISEMIARKVPDAKAAATTAAVTANDAGAGSVSRPGCASRP